jgi:NAD(P)-dependent dehydrogenase (short-subunit alcohol dehydrogenase family)
MSMLPATPSFRLDGRRALVTGGWRGIGLAAATSLAEHGAHVTLCSRNRKELNEVVTALRSKGYCAEYLVVDVTDIRSLSDAIAVSEPWDIFINNAGANRPNPFVEVSIEEFDFVMGLNVRSAFFAAQAVAKQMLEARRGGSIVNVSSQMGHVGAASRSLYCASKWAMEGFSRAMAIELAPHGIRVNTIAPTFIETPMTKPMFEDPAFKNDVLSKIKLGRIGKVEDLMGAFLFLASDASGLMTGSSLLVDGGEKASSRLISLIFRPLMPPSSFILSKYAWDAFPIPA